MAIHFIDIASYQAGLDLRAAASEIDGVIIKVTEDTGYVNPSCDGHWNQAGEAGLLRGFYHFAGNSDPVAEADYFMQHAAGYFGGGVPVLDWEGNQGVEWVNSFVRRVHDVKGVWCWIYANPWRFNQGGVEQNCMRWVASYPAVTSPTFAQAEGWDAPSVDGVVGAWQFASDGRLSCWGGNLDFDLFYGDASAWAAYCGSGASVPSHAAPQPSAPSSGRHVHYALHVKGGGWWDEVTDNTGGGENAYAGAPFAQHDMFYIYGDGVKAYRVHTIEDGWLDWVYKADKSDSVNGMAGVRNHTIDGYQIDGDVCYRAQTVSREGWLDTVRGTADFAGWYNEPSDKFQAWPA